MKISIFGLGIIGGTWADNLLQDGHEVRGWNRTPKPSQFSYTHDACAAAECAELLHIVVADPPAVQGVLDRIKPVLHSGQIVVQSSTISPAASRDFAAQVEATGASFLEAPFTGSKIAAEQRKLVFFVGGDKAVLKRARPVLSRLSSHIKHVGPVGSASAIKLAFNINIALVGSALGESLSFARAAGISDDDYFSALRLNVSWSGLAELKEPKLRAADYAPQFSLKHMGKDLRLALETAGGTLPLPQTRMLASFYQAALDRGWGDDDFIGLFRLVQGRAH
ncbi:MAG: NAD(P)-dependent oxidoreductase [Verrucomicrobia bacterium]|nr:NAD(P)-dependent oxidoreductase [Verrucomicrobiota bacterium]